MNFCKNRNWNGTKDYLTTLNVLGFSNAHSTTTSKDTPKDVWAVQNLYGDLLRMSAGMQSVTKPDVHRMPETCLNRICSAVVGLSNNY